MFPKASLHTVKDNSNWIGFLSKDVGGPQTAVLVRKPLPF